MKAPAVTSGSAHNLKACEGPWRQRRRLPPRRLRGVQILPPEPNLDHMKDGLAHAGPTCVRIVSEFATRSGGQVTTAAIPSSGNALPRSLNGVNAPRESLDRF